MSVIKDKEMLSTERRKLPIILDVNLDRLYVSFDN